jgi:hypothetical protein
LGYFDIRATDVVFIPRSMYDFICLSSKGVICFSKSWQEYSVIPSFYVSVVSKTQKRPKGCKESPYEVSRREETKGLRDEL